jgi:AAA+ ATPase superfamily predicted ATPase
MVEEKMVSKKTSPFICGGPVLPEYFTGREYELNKIFDQLTGYGYGSVAISGERRIGKTSLLKYIGDPDKAHESGLMKDKPILIYLDCQSISRFTPTRFWQRVLKLMLRNVEESTITSAKALLEKEEISSTDFEAVLDEIENQGKMLVLLLDEFEWVIRIDPKSEAVTCDFLSGLRALINSTPKALSLVLTTRKPLDDLCRPIQFMGSPFYNNFIFVRLKPFTNAEVDELLQNALKDTGTSFTPNECEYIRQIAGRHPLLVQIVGSLIFESHKSGLDEIDNYEYIGQKFEEQARHHFVDLWDYSTEQEQMLLMLIAIKKLEGRLNRKRTYDLGDLDLIFSQHERELKELADRGLVVKTKSDYEIFSSIFEWWVVKELENSNEEVLERRRKIFFGLLTNEQAEKVTKVVKFVKENKDAIASFSQWAAKAAIIGAI